MLAAPLTLPHWQCPTDTAPLPLPGTVGRDRIEEIETLLERKRHLLTLSSGLADGGARVRTRSTVAEEAEAEAGLHY